MKRRSILGTGRACQPVRLTDDFMNPALAAAAVPKERRSLAGAAFQRSNVPTVPSFVTNRSSVKGTRRCLSSKFDESSSSQKMNASNASSQVNKSSSSVVAQNSSLSSTSKGKGGMQMKLNQSKLRLSKQSDTSSKIPPPRISSQHKAGQSVSPSPPLNTTAAFEEAEKCIATSTPRVDKGPIVDKAVIIPQGYMIVPVSVVDGLKTLVLEMKSVAISSSKMAEASNKIAEASYQIAEASKQIAATCKTLCESKLSCNGIEKKPDVVVSSSQGNKENCHPRPSRKSNVMYQELKSDLDFLKTPSVEPLDKTITSAPTPRAALSQTVQLQLENLFDISESDEV